MGVTRDPAPTMDLKLCVSRFQPACASLFLEGGLRRSLNVAHLDWSAKLSSSLSKAQRRRLRSDDGLKTALLVSVVF